MSPALSVKNLLLFGPVMILLAPAYPGSAAEQVSTSSRSRPNVLWITFEDISPNLGCYGDTYAVTPNLDRLAEQGVRYTRVWSNAGLCSAARSTLISGMYAPSLGTQSQRSAGRVPHFVRGFPEYLRRAGYFCSNHAKADYNFEASDETWDAQEDNWRENGWRQRNPGQPFFTVINIDHTHSSQIYWRGEAEWRRRYAALAPEQRHDPAKAPVPPYYPDVPEVRQDLARYYDNTTFADRVAQRVLDQLARDGLAEDTIVFFFSDHGLGMPRGKSWCYESSLHVPLIIRFPEKYRQLAPAGPGETVDRLISFVDFAPTVLNLCGVEMPQFLQGKPFLGPASEDRNTYLFGHRDRMDERYELIRAVRNDRYKYIRNYLSHLPWFHQQSRVYPRLQPSNQVWHRLAAEGRLEGPTALFMAHRKPREELYDLENDPHEINNLAHSTQHQALLERMRAASRAWSLEIYDLGFAPEAELWLRVDESRDPRPHYTIVRQSPECYPLARIMATADLLDGGPECLDEQVKLLSDNDPSIRFWAALGIQAQRDINPQTTAALRVALNDPWPSIRIVAAETLCRLGETEIALPLLIELLQHPNSYVSLRAAISLHSLGETASAALPTILRLLDAQPDERVVGKIVYYPYRIMHRIAREMGHPRERVAPIER